MKKLSPRDGFTYAVSHRGTMVLVTIEDFRARPDFKGDRSAQEWPCIFRDLAQIGLDPWQAVVTLGYREEPVETDRKGAFNVGVVHLAWATAPEVMDVPPLRTPQRGSQSRRWPSDMAKPSPALHALGP